jgi:methylenetetrahydrofolate dehydrogenase (NADP+)/methenyltetrahydrofolate cyclohydrolase
MQLMDGKAVAESVRARAAERVEDFRRRTGRAPGLATVLVGDDPASRVYVSGKHRVSREVGLASFDVVLPADATQAQLEAEVDRLASDSDVDGMIVQLPLPAGLDAEAALARLPADKDVDGLTTLSQGRLATGAPGLRPATPSGVVELLRYYDVPLRARTWSSSVARTWSESRSCTCCWPRTRPCRSVTRGPPTCPP